MSSTSVSWDPKGNSTLHSTKEHGAVTHRTMLELGISEGVV